MKMNYHPWVTTKPGGLHELVDGSFFFIYIVHFVKQYFDILHVPSQTSYKLIWQRHV